MADDIDFPLGLMHNFLPYSQGNPLAGGPIQSEGLINYVSRSISFVR